MTSPLKIGSEILFDKHFYFSVFVYPSPHSSLVKLCFGKLSQGTKKRGFPHLNLQSNGIIIPKGWGSNGGTEGELLHAAGRAKLKQVEC